MKKLSKRSKFLLDAMNRAITIAKGERTKDNRERLKKLEDQVTLFLDPQRGHILDRKKKPKKLKPFKFPDGVSRRVIAGRINGRKGGLKTAAKYSKEQRQAWGHAAGSSTLARYGKEYFKHIRSLRKDRKPKNKA